MAKSTTKTDNLRAISIDAWLPEQPREVAVVIAARAALRVVPLLAGESSEGEPDVVVDDDVLPIFRAVAEPWVAARYPADDPNRALGLVAETGHYELKGGNIEFGGVGAARSHSTATDISGSMSATEQPDTATIDISASANATVRSASARANAAASAEAARAAAKAADDVKAARAAAAAVGHAADAFAAAGADTVTFWDALEDDVETAKRLEEPAQALASRILWARGNTQHGGLTQLWREMAAALGDHDDWDVWIGWYERQLNGRHLSEEIELAYVDFKDNIWALGPTVINAQIKRRLEELGYYDGHVVGKAQGNSTVQGVGAIETPVPELNAERELDERPAAFSFRVEGGKIVAYPQRDQPTDEAFARTIYDEVKRKLAGIDVKFRSSNAQYRVQQTVAGALDAMGQSYDDLNPALLLMKLRSLEADALAYDTEEGRVELFPDAIALINDAILSIPDLLSQFSVVQAAQANALALEVQNRDVEAIENKLAEAQDLAVAAPEVSESTVEALASHDADIENAREREAKAEIPELIAEARNQRAQHVAMKALSVRNFAARAILWGMEYSAEIAQESLKEVKKQVPKAIGQMAANTVKAMPAATLAALGYWVPAMAALLPIFAPLQKQLPKDDIADDPPDRMDV